MDVWLNGLATGLALGIVIGLLIVGVMHRLERADDERRP